MIGRFFHKNKNELKVNHLYLISVKLSCLKVLCYDDIADEDGIVDDEDGIVDDGADETEIYTAFSIKVKER